MIITARPNQFRTALAAWWLGLSASVAAPAADWPQWRGPNRDGISKETGLPDKWALNGENFLWRAPFGGRSSPIVMGNRVYVQNPAGRGPSLQERVMALDADTGKVVWEYKFNIFQSDVPPHRLGWASPAADPDTGNTVDMKVMETEPGLKGATVSNVTKPAKMETGLVVQVPPFINEGEMIRISTAEGTYQERA